MNSHNSNYSLSEADKAKLEELVSVLEISSGTKTIFAIAPESSPQHPVVENLMERLEVIEEHFQVDNFFYSKNSLHNFLYSLDDSKQQNSQKERKLVMAFGLDQLPTHRLVKEMQRLNLGREELFGRNLVLIFWLNKDKFLDEFRNRAPDFWDWRGEVVTFETHNPLLYSYLEWLIAENSYLEIGGVMQANRQVDIFLDQIYVSLQAQRRQQITETFEYSQREVETMTVDGYGLKMIDINPNDWDEPSYYEPLTQKFISDSSTKTVVQKMDLSEAVRENPYSVILGHPGAGKTTLLRYLALHFATARKNNDEIVTVDEDKKELGKTLFPIFLRLADYAEQLKQQPDLSLREYICRFYRQWETDFQANKEVATEVAGLLLDAMHQEQCLMLLDGLDEVFDQKSRNHIVERINQFVDEFPNHKFVISSRIDGYRDVQLSSRFVEFTIEDMNSEQIERFLYRWCRAIEEKQQPDAGEEQWQRIGDEQAKDILEAIEDNEGVKRLTVNPLLLRILVLIHRNGERLPHRRVRLYELAVQTLIEDWQLGKKLPDAPKVMLKENEVVQLLAPLAYWMHEEKPSGLVTQAEVEEKLATKLAELNDAEPESYSVRQAVAEFLRKVRETTGLFVERMPGVYGFMHLTFEEYFAARYIANNGRSEILHLIEEHQHEPRWEETILLALGYYSDHFPTQCQELIDKLFSNLKDYEPVLQYGEIKIKSFSPDDVKLIWLKAEDESANTLRQSEFNLRDLLFAGKVIAEVEVNDSLLWKITHQLVLTYVGIDADFEEDITKQILKLLRKIELFNQKHEIINILRQTSNDSTLSEEIRIKAKAAILYIACSEAELVNCATEIVNQLKPSLFCSLGDLMAEFGEEMTPALEASYKRYSTDKVYQKALNFILAMSYFREDKYDKAIDIFVEMEEESDTNLRPFVCWALAKCYEQREEYDKAINYYNRSNMADYFQQKDLSIFWEHWGWCLRLDEKYEQSLVYYQKALAVAEELLNSQYEANIFYNIGRLYQGWGKYEQAKDSYQQSRELYQHLGQEKNVANLWYWLGDCYREWGKYQQALECENHDLDIRRRLDDQVNIADAYNQLGRIYQGWGKYEQAKDSYQQSRELYQHLGREKNVADLWLWLGDCYREWGKYQQALECENHDLDIRRQLDDQVGIALAYYRLGKIYQGWGKYEQAKGFYQQSRELYQRLGDDKSMARRYRQLACCQGLLAKNTPNLTEAFDLLAQAEQNIRQAITINTAGEYQENLAYDYTSLSLLYSECLHLLSNNSLSIQEQIILFEEYYHRGLTYLDELGQTVDRSDQALDIGRAYLEVGVLENLDRAEDIAQECLQIFHKYNRRKQEASALKLLGEIYQKRAQRNQPDAESIATQFLSESLQIYQELDLQEKAVEVEQLIHLPCEEQRHFRQ